MNETPQVGDIFVSTWGYDQTNVDAYQVIRLTPKKMVLRMIATKPVPGSDGFMSCQVVPVKDEFTTAKTFLAPQANSFSLNYGYCRKHVDDKSYYCSWYA